MEWTDDGIVLSLRRHGESAAIVTLLTREHGRHSGLVRGAMGKSARGIYQPGNRLRATWRARLAEHLGTLQCELVTPHAAAVMADADRLACLTAACAVAEDSLAEHEAHPAAFEGLEILLQSLNGEDWPTVYVKWEVGLLSELGFGLDLSACAATGVTEDLVHVSPKSGRAVSREAGLPYRDRLLPLPVFLLEAGTAGDPDAVLQGLKLTQHFLESHVFVHRRESHQPPARQRLIERLKARATVE